MDLEGEFKKFVRRNMHMSNYTIPFWAERIIRPWIAAYRTYWKSVYRMRTGEIRAVRLGLYQVMREQPGIFQELWRRLSETISRIDLVIWGRVTDDGLVDWLALSETGDYDKVKNTILIDLLPNMKLLWNAWTKKSVDAFRRKVTRVRDRTEGNVSDGLEKFGRWLQEEQRYWRSAPPGVAINERTGEPDPEGTTRRPSQKKKRQAVAIGIGLAALVGSAVSATASQMSIHSMSAKLQTLGEAHVRDHGRLLH